MNLHVSLHRGYPKLGVQFLRVPIIWTIVFWGLCWGSTIFEEYQMSVRGLGAHSGGMKRELMGDSWGFRGVD